MVISLRVVPQLRGHLSLKFTHINRNFRSCSTFPHWACVCTVLWWVYAWLLGLNAVTVLWIPSAYYQEMSIKWTASKQPTANRTSLACKHFLAIKCLRMQDPWGFSEGVSSSESDLLKTVSKSSQPLKKQPHYGFRAAVSNLRLGGGDVNSRGWREDPVTKDSCHQAWPLEFNLLHSCGRRGELTPPSNPLPPHMRCGTCVCTQCINT